MFKLYVISLLCIFVNSQDFHPDTGLDIIQLATKYGYAIESHDIQTEDGYILTLHHIPNKKNYAGAKPVLLMHGVFSSSMDWINMGPQKALGLLLADAFGDVWLGNQRGNTWSRRHATLDPDQDAEKFFDFSFHEIGVYDLPAMIDYILDTTRQEKLFYVGHSQGTTSFFVMASERPEYNRKIILMTALAPVVYMKNLPNTIFQEVIQNYLDLFNTIVKSFKFNEILPHSENFFELGKNLCNGKSKYQSACVAVINLLVGHNSQLDPNFIPVLASNSPAGASMKQVKHFIQEMVSGNFCKFDYGILQNIEKYNQETPPLYNLKKITSPISLYYSSNDLLAAEEDVQKLEVELPNVVNSKKISMKKFNHIDFLFARDVVEILYKDIIAEMNLVQ